MLFDNANPFAGSKRPEDKTACYWYNALWNRVMSLYEWEGKPFEDGSLNADYLEFMLMTRGQAGFLFDKKGKFRGLDCTRIGLDPYGFPTTIESTNPVLGNLKGVVGVNAVWIRNNKFAQPVISTIAYYARQLGKVQTSLDVSLSNNRMTKVFKADNDAQANAIRKMVDDVDAGKLAVIQKPNIMENIMSGNNGDKIPVYSTPSEYLADKYLQNIRSILNDFYVTFGVTESGANQMKSQFNNIDEVNSNNQEIMINRMYWLEPRLQACKDVKKIFGIDINVKIREPKIFEYSEEDVYNELSKPESRDE